MINISKKVHLFGCNPFFFLNSGLLLYFVVSCNIYYSGLELELLVIVEPLLSSTGQPDFHFFPFSSTDYI